VSTVTVAVIEALAAVVFVVSVSTVIFAVIKAVAGLTFVVVVVVVVVTRYTDPP
jgi:hypothetical protein